MQLAGEGSSKSSDATYVTAEVDGVTDLCHLLMFMGGDGVAPSN